MRSLNVISLLLDYPSAELFEARRELVEELRADKALVGDQRDALIEFTEQLCTRDLMDAQETYVSLFDRGRSLSLLLFEHVHGESRDRGQAMVDLMSVYEKNGFVLDARELPDYLPLFLEYLSKRPAEEAVQWLGEVCHILSLLEARLTERDSDYAVLFESLLSLAGVAVEREALREQVAREERDDTPEALDKVWEEEMVRFTEGSAQDCGDNAVLQRRAEIDRVRPLHIQPMSQQPATSGAN